MVGGASHKGAQGRARFTGLTVLQVGVLRCETTWWLTWAVAKGPSPPRFSGL